MTDLLLNAVNLDFFNRVLAKGRLVNSYIFASEGASLEKYLIAKKINKILNCSLNYGRVARRTSSRLRSTNDRSVLRVREDHEDDENAEIGVSLHAHYGLEKGFAPACDHCQNCKWIESDSHPKTPIVIALEKGRNIKLEDIKKLQNTLSQSSDFFRIIIIDPADRQYLNAHSANALLKDIEEAHPRTLFLLFASNRRNVLSTLRSRSQCLQIFSEPSLENSRTSESELLSPTSLEEPKLENTDEKSIMLIFKKYQENANLSPELKKIFFLEELKSFERDDFISFCENLEGKLLYDLLENGTETSSYFETCVKSLEIARQDLLAYVNPRAALGKVELFR